jgi:uncharacterized protein (DUF2236 family)
MGMWPAGRRDIVADIVFGSHRVLLRNRVGRARRTGTYLSITATS